ncbi:hypothetical protein QJS10_CPB17g01422 [Acorus calamus]|uniref:Uncharacterized protein n=1 Tax=Acorus calamus TaxID=4465 RepID=A0AAV9CTX3_ACOCL|nr:hypothetical protein QJS10_CPB17g01422 [Acorus calamus]
MDFLVSPKFCVIYMQNFSSQNRVRLMHCSLFILVNHEDNRDGIIDIYFQDRYLNAIEKNAQYLLRYVATAVIVYQMGNNMLRLIKVIQKEEFTYKDPIIEFLECVYVTFDFDGALRKLQECNDVLMNNPFLWTPNSTAVSLTEQFLENASHITERFCHIHQYSMHAEMRGPRGPPSPEGRRIPEGP